MSSKISWLIRIQNIFGIERSWTKKSFAFDTDNRSILPFIYKENYKPSNLIWDPSKRSIVKLFISASSNSFCLTSAQYYCVNLFHDADDIILLKSRNCISQLGSKVTFSFPFKPPQNHFFFNLNGQKLSW